MTCTEGNHVGFIPVEGADYFTCDCGSITYHNIPEGDPLDKDIARMREALESAEVISKRLGNIIGPDHRPQIIELLETLRKGLGP